MNITVSWLSEGVSSFIATYLCRNEIDEILYILKECYLDELDPNRGVKQKKILEDCSIFCECSLRMDNLKNEKDMEGKN